MSEGKLTGDAQTKRAFEFFGIVGPWYTVGYRMAVVIEESLGREKGETLPRWTWSKNWRPRQDSNLRPTA